MRKFVAILSVFCDGSFATSDPDLSASGSPPSVSRSRQSTPTNRPQNRVRVKDESTWNRRLKLFLSSVATGAVIGAIAFLVLRTVKGENVTELRDRSSRLETENRDLRDEIIKCKANREWLETHGCPGMQEQDGCSPHTCTVVERIRVDFGMEKVPWPELPDAVRNKINLMEQRYEESEAAISSLNNKIINNKEQARGVDDARNEIPKLQDEVLELESRWNGLRVDNENIKTLNEHYHDQVQHGCKASCPSCQPCPACNCSQNSTDPAK